MNGPVSGAHSKETPASAVRPVGAVGRVVAMKVLTHEQNAKVARWKLKHHRVLLGRAHQYSGWSAADVEEAVQHTWLKVVLHVELVEKLPEERVLPYLVQVLLNHIHDIARAQVREAVAAGALMERSPETAPEPPQRWMRVSDEQLARAILTLSRRVREAYVLRRQGLKHREVAERMGITVGCAGTLLHEAHKRLRQELERSGV